MSGQQITSAGLFAAVANLQNIIKALPNLKADSEAAAKAAAKTAAKKQTEESLKAAGISGPIAPKAQGMAALGEKGSTAPGDKKKGSTAPGDKKKGTAAPGDKKKGLFGSVSPTPPEESDSAAPDEPAPPVTKMDCKPGMMFNRKTQKCIVLQPTPEPEQEESGPPVPTPAKKIKLGCNPGMILSAITGKCVVPGPTAGGGKKTRRTRKRTRVKNL